MPIAWVEVLDSKTEKMIERFPIQYSSRIYPSPDDLREEIEKGLKEYLTKNKIDAKVESVAIEGNEVVGHFFESIDRPRVRKGRVFVVVLSGNF